MCILITEWEGRVSSNRIEVLNSFYSECHPSLALEKAVPSLSHLLSSLSCLAAMIRGVRLERGLAESKKGCCPEEKKTNELWLSELISSWAPALFLEIPQRCRNRSEGTICTSVFMSSTFLSHVQFLEYLAYNSINPFIKVSPAWCNICPARTLGMLLAVQEFSSFRKHKILT